MLHSLSETTPLGLSLEGTMEISDEQRMEMSIVERHHLPPSSHGNGVLAFLP
jgi:hypothetical protein